MSYRLLTYLDDDSLAIEVNGQVFSAQQVLINTAQGIISLEDLWSGYYQDNDLKSTHDIVVDILNQGNLVMARV